MSDDKPKPRPSEMLRAIVIPGPKTPAAAPRTPAKELAGQKDKADAADRGTPALSGATIPELKPPSVAPQDEIARLRQELEATRGELATYKEALIELTRGVESLSGKMDAYEQAGQEVDNISKESGFDAKATKVDPQAQQAILREMSGYKEFLKKLGAGMKIFRAEVNTAFAEGDKRLAALDDRVEKAEIGLGIKQRTEEEARGRGIFGFLRRKKAM